MNVQQIIDGLTFLGFTSGYAIGNNPAEIILWENDKPKPSMKQIEDASADGAFQREYDAVNLARKNAYRELSDPLFFQYQRGEVTEQAWLDSVAAVNAEYPYPVKSNKL